MTSHLTKTTSTQFWWRQPLFSPLLSVGPSGGAVEGVSVCLTFRSPTVGQRLSFLSSLAASTRLNTAVLPPQEARSIQIINRHRLFLAELNNFSSKNCCFHAYGCTGILSGCIHRLERDQLSHGPWAALLLIKTCSWDRGGRCSLGSQTLQARSVALRCSAVRRPQGCCSPAQPLNRRDHLLLFYKLCHDADILCWGITFISESF